MERLLVVGLGSIGRRHAEVARNVRPDVKILALRHRGGREPDGKVDETTTSLERALTFAPQAAVIANPASHHLEAALPLARAGVHLLMEKPLSDSPTGVAELIGLCRSRQLTLMVGYNLRFEPALQRFKEVLDEGLIGRVLSVRAEVGQYLPSWRPGTDYRGTVSANASLGGGALLELSHEIDYLRWVFGPISWVSAVQHRASSLEIDVEDTVHLALGLGPSGLVAALSMDFIRHDKTRTCTAIGEKGSLRWNAVAGTVEVFEAGGHSWRAVDTPATGEDTYHMEWRHFLQCIAEGAAPLVSGDDGLAVLRVVEAARQSANTGRVVTIEDALV